MEIDTSSLRKISSYATLCNSSRMYVTKLIQVGKIVPVNVDGKLFIDISQFTLPDDV